MSDAYSSLKTVSARVGKNPLLVQGGGGNSSIKEDDVLIVKGSGTWLSDAEEADIFVPLDLSRARAIIQQGGDDFSSAVRSHSSARELRPSIETVMHVMMPHQCVMHAHAVGSICASIRSDRAEFLEDRLADLKWAIVPYVKPGADLGKRIARSIDDSGADILVLQNHGVVVGADDPEKCELILKEVERRLLPSAATLEFPSGPNGSAPLEGYRWVEDPRAQALAYSKRHATAIIAGALVPDQVVYLGGAAVWLNSIGDFDDCAKAWVRNRGVKPGLVFLENSGAMIREDASLGGSSIVGVLVEIAHRMPPDTAITVLSESDEYALLNWEAEKFRQQVDAKRSNRA